MRRLVTLGICLLLPCAYDIEGARADIYSWKDSTGKTHFTDNPSKIPEQFRDDLYRVPADKAVPYKPPAPTLHLSGKPQQEPDAGLGVGEFSVPIFKEKGGSYAVKAILNGRVEVALLVDTGASIVVLSEQVAEKLGAVNLESGPQIALNTAGGKVTLPLVTLDEFQLPGGVGMRDVKAVINNNEHPPGIDGLLGMNVLGAYTVFIDSAASRMILKPLEKP